MTDNTQPEALRLADALERPGYGWHSTPAQCAAELRRQYAELETLRAGYDAARLEIESLKAQSADAIHGEHAELRRLSDCCPELNLSNYGPDDVGELNGWAIEVSQCIDRALAAQPAGAQQPATAYAALMQAASDWICENVPTGTRGATAWATKLQNVANALRAPPWQAPAQATPTCKDSTPELHIGDSAFESWYSSYNPTHKGDKQRARDAYAAGMGDSLVMAAPTTQPAPQQDVSAAGGDSFLLLPTRPTPDAPANWITPELSGGKAVRLNGGLDRRDENKE